jgi:hypothetical protein
LLLGRVEIHGPAMIETADGEAEMSVPEWVIYRDAAGFDNIGTTTTSYLCNA